MMHSVRNHDKGFVRRVAAPSRMRRMRSRLEPGISVPIDEGKPGVLDVKTAVLVDVLYFGGLMDIKRLSTDGTGVGNIDQA